MMLSSRRQLLQLTIYNNRFSTLTCLILKRRKNLRKNRENATKRSSNKWHSMVSCQNQRMRIWMGDQGQHHANVKVYRQLNHKLLHGMNLKSAKLITNKVKKIYKVNFVQRVNTNVILANRIIKPTLLIMKIIAMIVMTSKRNKTYRIHLETIKHSPILGSSRRDGKEKMEESYLKKKWRNWPQMNL